MFPKPVYVVVDKASDGANFVNMVGCLISQLRIKDVFYNATINPNRLPYTALVDMNTCQSSGNNNDGSGSLTPWYVMSNGPTQLGNGIYTTTAVFQMQAGQSQQTVNMHVMLINRIKNGTSVTSQLSFIADGNMMMGGVALNFTDPHSTVVESQQKQGPTSNYFKTKFDPFTHIGSAITGQSGGDNYKLQFNENAYRRQQINGSDICVDFRLAKRILSADSYQLFNAADGSRVSINLGVVVQKTVANFPSPLQLYIGYYGTWSMPATDNTGKRVTDTFSYFNDGDTVSKIDYQNPNSNIQYTFKKVNARLTKVTKGSVTLDQIKGNINKTTIFNSKNY